MGFLLKMDENKEAEHKIYIVWAPHFKPSNLTPTSSSCSIFTLKLATATYIEMKKWKSFSTWHGRTPSVGYGLQKAEDTNINSSYLSNWHHRAKSFLRIHELLNCSRNSVPFMEHESSLQCSKDYQSFIKQYQKETRLN